MIVAGCDVGSLTSKAVIMKDGRIAGSSMVRSRPKPWESAEEAMKIAAEGAGISINEISYSVGTGYGRNRIPFVREAVSEIACHGKGAHWLVSSARTVIDIGGQDCKAIRIDGRGSMARFVANDKCASGTGRFLEVMVKVLGVSLDDLGSMSARSRNPVTMASACTVWAQADVIRYLNDRVPVEDIAAGINNAMAGRIALIANSVGVEPELCVTGGVAKNAGVVDSLEKLLGVRIRRIKRADPQLAGAIGAAVIAAEKLNGGLP